MSEKPKVYIKYGYVKFSIGNQVFTLNYHPDTKLELQWMVKMLKKAFAKAYGEKDQHIKELEEEGQTLLEIIRKLDPKQYGICKFNKKDKTCKAQTVGYGSIIECNFNIKKDEKMCEKDKRIKELKSLLKEAWEVLDLNLPNENITQKIFEYLE